ncbi:MAG: ABC transporter substrate-binding protein [Ancrocorticia sp.]|uniref:ABC transporter substrate-binding protein n=1 Tax=Ancrocorticia sp. TaxID=2593684 RepID=UPI003F90909D
MTVTDWTGHEETFEEAPQKVAILSGTPLNLWYDVSGTAIATSNISENVHVSEDYKAEIEALPMLGEPFSVDAEKLVELDPDLVITMFGMQDTLSSQLQELGFRTLTVRTNDLSDLDAVYDIFGALNGTSDVADERVSQIHEETDAVTAQWPGESGESAVILFQSEKSLSVKLDNSIAGAMLSELGVTNIASGLPHQGSDSAVLDLEEIVKQQPEYVLVTGRFTDPERSREVMEAEFEKNAAWQSVDAVKEGRVIYLPQEYFLYNAGPDYALAFEYLAASLHPETYGEPVAP